MLSLPFGDIISVAINYRVYVAITVEIIKRESSMFVELDIGFELLYVQWPKRIMDSGRRCGYSPADDDAPRHGDAEVMATEEDNTGYLLKFIQSRLRSLVSPPCESCSEMGQ